MTRSSTSRLALAAAATVATTLVGSVPFAPVASAATASPTVTTATGGLYQPVRPTRLVDLRAGTRAKPLVAGKAGIPAAARYVQVALTLVPPTSTAVLTAGGLPVVATNRNVITTQDVALPLNGDGTLSLVYTDKARVVVDVLGYYTPGPIARGGSQAFPFTLSTRVMDTTHGIGGAPVAPGQLRTLMLGGRANLPATGVANVKVLLVATTKASTLLTLRSSTARDTAAQSILVRPGAPTVVQLDVATASQPNLLLKNLRGGTPQVAMYVVGRTLSTPYPTKGSFLAVAPATAVAATSTRTTSNRILTLPLVGKGGVPLTGVRAIRAELTVTSDHAGIVSLGSSTTDLRRVTNATALRNGTVKTRVVIPVTSKGSAYLGYSAPGKIAVNVRTLGYVTGVTVDPPEPPARPGVPVVSPTTPALTQTGQTQLTGIIPAAEAGIARIELVLDGVVALATLDRTNSPPTWSYTGISPVGGTVPVTVRAVDNIGQYSETVQNLTLTTPAENVPLLMPQAFVAPTGFGDSIESYDPVTRVLVLNSISSGLQPGQSLSVPETALTPDGLLATVVSLTLQGSKSIVQLTPASITDVIAQADVIINDTPGPASGGSFRRHATVAKAFPYEVALTKEVDGKTPTCEAPSTPSPSPSAEPAPSTTPCPTSSPAATGTGSYKVNLEAKIAGEVVAEATCELKIGLKKYWGIPVKPIIKKLKLGGALSYDGLISAKVTGEAEADIEASLAPLRLAHIPMQIGPIPFVIVPTLNIAGKAHFTAAASVEAQIDGAISQTPDGAAAMRPVSFTGRRGGYLVIDNGDLGGEVVNTGALGDHLSLKVAGKVTADIRFTPSFELSINDLGGPQIKAAMGPSLEASASYSTFPDGKACYEFVLSDEIKVTLGGRLDFLKKDLPERTLYDHRDELKREGCSSAIPNPTATPTESPGTTASPTPTPTAAPVPTDGPPGPLEVDSITSTSEQDLNWFRVAQNGAPNSSVMDRDADAVVMTVDRSSPLVPPPYFSSDFSTTNRVLLRVSREDHTAEVVAPSMGQSSQVYSVNHDASKVAYLVDGEVYLWERATSATVYTIAKADNGVVERVMLSNDGDHLAWFAGGNTYVRNLATGVTTLIGPDELQDISDDASTLVLNYSVPATPPYNAPAARIRVWHNGATFTAPVNPDPGTVGANEADAGACVSGDGQVVFYRSASPNNNELTTAAFVTLTDTSFHPVPANDLGDKCSLDAHGTHVLTQGYDLQAYLSEVVPGPIGRSGGTRLSPYSGTGFTPLVLAPVLSSDATVAGWTAYGNSSDASNSGAFSVTTGLTSRLETSFVRSPKGLAGKTVAVSPQGATYFTGVAPAGGFEGYALPENTVFVGKLNPDSSLAWVAALPHASSVDTLRTDAEGDVYALVASPESGAPVSYRQAGTNTAEAFSVTASRQVAKLSSEGTWRWAKPAGGGSVTDEAFDIVGDVGMFAFSSRGSSFYDGTLTSFTSTDFKNTQYDSYTSVILFDTADGHLRSSRQADPGFYGRAALNHLGQPVLALSTGYASATNTAFGFAFQASGTNLGNGDDTHLLTLDPDSLSVINALDVRDLFSSPRTSGAQGTSVQLISSGRFASNHDLFVSSGTSGSGDGSPPEERLSQLDDSLTEVRTLSQNVAQTYEFLQPQADGSVVIASSFGGTLTLGDKSLTESAGTQGDAFVAKIRPDGSIAWISSLGTNVGDAPLALAAAPGGRIVLLAATGRYATYNTTIGPINFSPMRGAYSPADPRYANVLAVLTADGSWSNSDH